MQIDRCVTVTNFVSFFLSALGGVSSTQFFLVNFFVRVYTIIYLIKFDTLSASVFLLLQILLLVVAYVKKQASKIET